MITYPNIDPQTLLKKTAIYLIETEIEHKRIDRLFSQICKNWEWCELFDHYHIILDLIGVPCSNTYPELSIQQEAECPDDYYSREYYTDIIFDMINEGRPAIKIYEKLTSDLAKEKERNK